VTASRPSRLTQPKVARDTGDQAADPLRKAGGADRGRSSARERLKVAVVVGVQREVMLDLHNFDLRDLCNGASQGLTQARG
jgi:hypothetical protein